MRSYPAIWFSFFLICVNLCNLRIVLCLPKRPSLQRSKEGDQVAQLITVHSRFQPLRHDRLTALFHGFDGGARYADFHALGRLKVNRVGGLVREQSYKLAALFRLDIVGLVAADNGGAGIEDR